MAEQTSLFLPECPVIVVGAGVAGLSSALQAVQNGSNVILIDKNLRSGGNSLLASTGMNGFQKDKQPDTLDSPTKFKDDLIKFAEGRDGALNDHTKRLISLICDHSIDSIGWLEAFCDFKFDKRVKTAGCTYERTLGCSESRLLGSLIVSRLLDKFMEKCEENPERYKVLDNCKLVDLITSRDVGGEADNSEKQNEILGIVCEWKSSQGKQIIKLTGPTILTTGGFGSSLNYIVQKRPDLARFATASRTSCNSDILEIVLKHGGELTNMEDYQLVPIGLVPFDSNHENSSAGNVNVAPDYLIQLGTLISDSVELLNGIDVPENEICMSMVRHENQRNFLVLNDVDYQKHSEVLAPLAKRGYLKRFFLTEFCKDFKMPLKKTTRLLQSQGIPFSTNQEEILVIQLVPTILIPLGGIKTSPSMEVKGLRNLFAAGEIVGGIHGSRMIIGTSLLSCVVFGRIAAQNATSLLLSTLSNRRSRRKAIERLDLLNRQLNPRNDDIAPDGGFKHFSIPDKEFTWEEISRHTDRDDCWLVVKNVVLNVSRFLPDHPGGANSIIVNGGTDVTNNFEMFHNDSMILNNAKDCIIGRVKGKLPYLEYS